MEGMVSDAEEKPIGDAWEALIESPLVSYSLARRKEGFFLLEPHFSSTQGIYTLKKTHEGISTLRKLLPHRIVEKVSGD